MRKGLILSLMMLFLLNCSPAYRLQQYYSQTLYQDFPPTERVSVYSFTDSGLNDLKREGYIVLGYSSFNGPLQNQNMYQDFGRKVGADVVLIKNTFTDTRHGNISLPQYQPGQTYNINSHEQGNIRYNNNTANYNSYSQSTVTSSGKTTYQQIPVAVQRYDQYAIYLRNPANHDREKNE